MRDLRRALLRSRVTMEAVAGLMESGIMGGDGAPGAGDGLSEAAKGGEDSDSEGTRAKVSMAVHVLCVHVECAHVECAHVECVHVECGCACRVCACRVCAC